MLVGVSVNGLVTFALKLELEVSDTIDASFVKEFETTLFEFESPLPTMVIGPVSVTQAVKFALRANCRLEASAEARLTAGASLVEPITLAGDHDRGRPRGRASGAAAC